MSDLTLTVNGKRYSGWKAARAQRSIEQASGAFALVLTERWPGQPRQWPIEPGAACRLELDGTPVITGHVDSVERTLSADQHEIRVNGRDAAGDLVDCSALLPGDRTDSIFGLNLLQLAQKLCAYYDVPVVTAVDPGRPFNEGDLQPYETVWECISRSARRRALLFISDGVGGLVLTRAGNAVNATALVEGENVLEARLIRDDSKRFNKYIARSQGKTNGTMEQPIDVAISGEAVAVDEAVREPRTLLFEPDDLADGLTLRDRVRWERNIRRGRGRKVDVTVQGWSANGRLWVPNEMVSVRIPTLGIDGQLLVVSVDYALGESGSLTTLTLAPREAYDLLPEAEAKQAGGSFNIDPETLELLK